MLREQGVVVAVTDGVARVAMDATEHTRCGACGLCRAAKDGKQMLLDARAPEGISVGDRVTVEVPLPGPGRSAVLLLLVPLVLFVGGLILGEVLRAKGVLPGGSGMSLAPAFGLMVVWYVAVAVYDRHLRRSPEHEPRIIGRPRDSG